MRLIARFFLWLLGIAIPIFIAACYGPPARFSKSGKVIDSESKQGVDGIEVSCLLGDQAEDITTTYGGGDFLLYFNTACDQLRFDDVDGDQNGVYQSRTIPYCSDCQDITVELVRQK